MRVGHTALTLHHDLKLCKHVTDELPCVKACTCDLGQSGATKGWFQEKEENDETGIERERKGQIIYTIPAHSRWNDLPARTTTLLRLSNGIDSEQTQHAGA